jgi:hypothetical protein
MKGGKKGGKSAAAKAAAAKATPAEEPKPAPPVPHHRIANPRPKPNSNPTVPKNGKTADPDRQKVARSDDPDFTPPATTDINVSIQVTSALGFEYVICGDNKALQNLSSKIIAGLVARNKDQQLKAVPFIELMLDGSACDTSRTHNFLRSDDPAPFMRFTDGAGNLVNPNLEGNIGKLRSTFTAFFNNAKISKHGSCLRHTFGRRQTQYGIVVMTSDSFPGNIGADTQPAVPINPVAGDPSYEDRSPLEFPEFTAYKLHIAEKLLMISCYLYGIDFDLAVEITVCWFKGRLAFLAAPLDMGPNFEAHRFEWLRDIFTFELSASQRTHINSLLTHFPVDFDALLNFMEQPDNIAFYVGIFAFEDFCNMNDVGIKHDDLSKNVNGPFERLHVADLTFDLNECCLIQMWVPRINAWNTIPTPQFVSSSSMEIKGTGGKGAAYWPTCLRYSDGDDLALTTALYNSRIPTADLLSNIYSTPVSSAVMSSARSEILDDSLRRRSWTIVLDDDLRR